MIYDNNTAAAIATAAIIALTALLVGFIGGAYTVEEQRDAARAEAADLRAQLAEAHEQKILVVEPPKDMQAVNEAYTPAAPQTITVNGQKCERVTADESLGMTSLGSFTVTHYCTCSVCCGKSNGITASGRAAKPYCSIAVDPSVIPLGTTVWLDYGDGVLHEARADDTGGAVVGNKIDLCVGDHASAIQYGVRAATVYVGGRQDG